MHCKSRVHDLGFVLMKHVPKGCVGKFRNNIRKKTYLKFLKFSSSPSIWCNGSQSTHSPTPTLPYISLIYHIQTQLFTGDHAPKLAPASLSSALMAVAASHSSFSRGRPPRFLRPRHRWGRGMKGKETMSKDATKSNQTLIAGEGGEARK